MKKITSFTNIENNEQILDIEKKLFSKNKLDISYRVGLSIHWLILTWMAISFIARLTSGSIVASSVIVYATLFIYLIALITVINKSISKHRHKLVIEYIKENSHKE